MAYRTGKWSLLDVRTAMMHVRWLAIAFAFAVSHVHAAPENSDDNVTSKSTAKPSSAVKSDLERDLTASDDVGAIIVTARRRDERLQDVPMAVTGIRGSDVERLEITRTEDIERVTPGLNVTTSVYGSSNLTVTIRGQRQGLNNGPYDSSVGVYFAEVPQARTQGLNAGLYDIESIQVLKGPQGTLFGRNTTGGAVLITPQSPTNKFEGYGQMTLGDYGTVNTEGAVNLPLSDALQLRFSVQTTRHDGYLRDPTMGYNVEDANNYSWRAAAKIRFSDELENTLFVTGFRELDDGVAFKLTKVAGFGVGPNRDGFAQISELQDSSFWTTTSFVPPKGTDITTYTVANTTTLNLIDDQTLKNIFGFRRTDSSLNFNIAGDRYSSDYLNVVDKGNQWSDEVNLSGKALNRDLDYFAGLFYFIEKNYSTQRSQFLMFQPLSADATSPGTVTITNAPDIINTSYSAYGQSTYHVPDTRLSLTGGLRWTYDKREITWKNFILSASPVPGALPVFVNPPICRMTDANGVRLSPCVREGEKAFSAPTYTLTADYKVSDNLLIYLANRRGYRSGGFTFTAQSATQATPYRPEFVTDFESGAKGSLRFSENASFYYDFAAYLQKYEDVQKLVNFTPPGTTLSQVYFVNAAKATIKGIEVSGDLNVGPLELQANYAYSNAVYDEFRAAFTTIQSADYSGARFAGAPEHTFGWLARLRVAGSDDVGQFYVQASGYYQSSSVAIDATNYDPVHKVTAPWTILGSRHIVDARLEWANVMGKPLDLQIYAKNLFNEKYLTGMNDGIFNNALGFTSALVGDPRTVGVVMKYKF